MYIVVIGVLAIVLTRSGMGPAYCLLAPPEWVLAGVAAATLLPATLGVPLARRVVRLLDRDPENPSRGQYAFGRGMMLLQFAVGALHATLLLCTPWMLLCARVPVVGQWPLVPGLLALVPFLLSIILVWTVVYPADRAVRQIALEVYLFRGKPLRPVWPLWQYLQFNLRHQVLFILVPMMLILLASDLVEQYEQAIRKATGQPYAPDMVVGLAAVLVAVVAPEILRHVWVTRRLPDGPLRDRLLQLCRQLRLRCRDILVWRSGGMIVNAAVMGVIAPLRYVLITDAMLEQMDDRKIEAVFGHEAGHVKHHHIPCFLLFALISGCIVTIFSVYTRDVLRTDQRLYHVLLAGLGVVLMLKWGVVFFWISRRFERQADTYGVRTLTRCGLPCTQPCLVHAPQVVGSTPDDSPDTSDEASAGTPVQPPRGGDALCTTAAQLFGHALNEVAVLNGIPPEARSWRHSSIASRSRFLQQLAIEPDRNRRFQRLVLGIQVAIVLVAAVVAAWAATALHIWDLLGDVLAAIGVTAPR